MNNSVSLQKPKNIYDAKCHAMLDSLGKFACRYKNLPTIEELGKINFVDLSLIKDYNDKELIQFWETEGLFSILPPFSECLLKLRSELGENGALVEVYAHIKVLEIDKETGKAVLDLQMYCTEKFLSYSASLMPCLRYVFSFNEVGKSCACSFYENTCSWAHDFLGLQNKEKPSALEVDKQVKRLQMDCNIPRDMEGFFLAWLNDIIASAKELSQARKNDLKNLLFGLTQFNLLLSKHRCVQTKDYNAVKSATPFELRIDRKDKRVVRRLGQNILIRSAEPPKRSDKEHGVTYTLSSWSRRGHARHYKSGKVVWINEQEVHRKAFGEEKSGVVTSRDYIAVPSIDNSKKKG